MPTAVPMVSTSFLSVALRTELYRPVVSFFLSLKNISLYLSLLGWLAIRSFFRRSGCRVGRANIHRRYLTFFFCHQTWQFDNSIGRDGNGSVHIRDDDTVSTLIAVGLLHNHPRRGLAELLVLIERQPRPDDGMSKK